MRIGYHLEGLSREELDAYPLFDDTARQALYQATKGILRKVNKLAMTDGTAGNAAVPGGTGLVASAGHSVRGRRTQSGQVASGRQSGSLAGGRRGPHRLSSGQLLSATQGLGHFVEVAKTAAAEVIVLDPLYSAHDQDDTIPAP